MTDIDLAAVRARVDAATEGPWTWTDHRVPDLMGRAGDPDTYEYDTEVIEASHSGECGCRSACTLELAVSPQDREFIAHARGDIPALLAAVRDAQQRAEQAEAEAHRLRERHDPRCLTLTEGENNVHCDCRTLALIEGGKAVTARAEQAEQALARVRALTDEPDHRQHAGTITPAQLLAALDGGQQEAT